MKSDSSFGKRQRKNERNATLVLKRPDFLKVPRAALQHPDLSPRDSYAVALILYRYRGFHGRGCSGAEIGRTLGRSRVTGARSLNRLRKLGFLDVDNAPTPQALELELSGFLKVPIENVLRYGELEALMLAQLPTLRLLRMARIDRFGRVQVSAAGLESLLGFCRETAIAVLKRLASGVTTRVKRAIRLGMAYVVQPLVELTRQAGRAFFMRLLGERALKPVAKPSISSRPAAATEAPQGYVPTREEFAQMRRAATRQRAP